MKGGKKEKKKTMFRLRRHHLFLFYIKVEHKRRVQRRMFQTFHKAQAKAIRRNKKDFVG